MDKLILYTQSLDLYNMTEKELQETVDYVISSVSITKFRRTINSACKYLSGVTEPRFMADLDFIWKDNQQRLNLIWRLLDYAESFESYIKNIKTNKQNCRANNDYMFGFLDKTCDVLKTVNDVNKFQLKEFEENQKAIEENNKKLLRGKYG